MPRGLSDYDSARIQGRLWTPEVLRPDFWFDAADQSTITISSGNVTQWNDKSGNARNLTTASSYPSYSIEGRNGLNVVTFSGSSLAVTGLSINYTAQSTFGAFRLGSYPLYARVWTQSDAGIDFSTSGAYIPIVSGPATPTWCSYTTNFESQISLTDGAWCIFSSVHNGAVLRNAANGVLAALASATLSKTFTRFGMTDSFSGATVPFSGDYGELVVLPTGGVTRDRVLVEGYLSWKWAIPLAANHPFANRPPLIGD
jgi:hypothetical protein